MNSLILNSCTTACANGLANKNNRKNSFVPVSNIRELEKKQPKFLSDFYTIEISSCKNFTIGTLDDEEEENVRPTNQENQPKKDSDDSASVLSFDELPYDDFHSSKEGAAIDEEPYEFQILDDYEPNSWSIHVMDRDYRPGDTFWFRLARNDDTQAALYLEGEEILVSVNAILKGEGENDSSSFYVHFVLSDRFVYLADKLDVRTLLKRTLYQSKMSHSGAQLVREVIEKNNKDRRSIQDLTTRALYPNKYNADEMDLSMRFPDMFMLLHYGKSLQAMKEESVAEEAYDDSSTERRSRSTRSHSPSQVFDGSD